MSRRRSLLAVVVAGAAAAAVALSRRTQQPSQPPVDRRPTAPRRPERASAPAPRPAPQAPPAPVVAATTEVVEEGSAADQRLVADLLTGHPHVVVAEADPGGLRLDQARAEAIERREEWSETLWRLAFGALRRHGVALTGIRASEVRFLDDGAVAIVDLGAVEHVEPVALERYAALVRAALAGDDDRISKAVSDLGGEVPEEWWAPLVDPQRSPVPVGPAGASLPGAAAPIDRLHTALGGLVEELGATLPVASIMAELWRGAEPVTRLGVADRDWWNSRETLSLLDRLAARTPKG